MYGDYSRGHEPDRKRGRSYRRVLLQMGRPVLDSDVASMVDALLGEVRTTTRGLSCEAGSPDLGFLVTPGRLLCLFADAQEALTVQSGTPNAWIDYRYRFADRYPALHLAASGGVGASVRLPLLQPLDQAAGGNVALWVRVGAPARITLNGSPRDVAPASPAIQRVEFPAGTSTLDPLQIGIRSGEEVWLFLLEQDEAAGSTPAFSVAPGSYHVDGLVVDSHGGGRFPGVSFPDSAGFPWKSDPGAGPPLGGLVAPGSLADHDRLVAYLETWERHITAVEDPGIREMALGQSDTCARTELVGQVKLARVTGGANTAQVRAAFDNVQSSLGQLTIAVEDGDTTTDPCALPDLAGYSGADNRLYRVEVHDGGGLTTVRLKWSRDNGSELFEAPLNSAGTNFTFPGDTPLAGGDIVEVLSNVVDLGDESLATVGASGFAPAQRAVGQLAQLAVVEGSADTDEVVFSLVDLNDDNTPVALNTTRVGKGSERMLKLRRWHGILDPKRIAGAGTPPAGPYVLEEGIAVTLSSGTYRPGQWWQYEARVAGNNDNGPWRPAPHGPERRVAPLALLEFRGAAEPVQLVAWLDERFSHPCDLDADAVDFAGTRVGSASDTVQEAIEELFERPLHIGTCTVTVSSGDDLAAAVAELPAAGGELCFEAGTYSLATPLVVTGRSRIVVHGAGPATVIRATGAEAALVFENCNEIAVRTLRVEGGTASSSGTREHLNGAITFRGGGEVAVSDCFLSCPDAQAGPGGRAERTQTCLTAVGGARPLRVRLERNHFEVGTMQAGVLLLDPTHAYVVGNVVRVTGVRDLATGRVADEGIVVAGGAVGTVEILDNLVEQTIQGIHVAASGPAAGRESADAVLLSRNVVHARVPAAHKRGRHAVFVGNARSVHVKDTIATLERTGSGGPTAVDAIRLHGVFGPFVAVRQTSVRSFTTGVRVEPIDPVPSPRMWLVAETMAEAAGLGAEVPESVEHERNYPERRFVATLTLAPAATSRAVETAHTITATARDVQARPVSGVVVYFTVVGPANKQAAHPVTTNAAGIAPYTYTGAKVGHDTISAFADSNGNGRQDANEPSTLASVSFVSAAPAAIVLTKSAATSARGSAVTVTATARTSAGAASPDARVVFEVTGANPQAKKAVTTNALGQAQLTYTGAKAGKDTIRAFVDLNANSTREANEPEQTVDHDFAIVATSLVLLPAGGVVSAGGKPVFNATVRDATGAAVQGVTVRFTVTGPNATTASAVTDPSGVATFQYPAAAKAGADTIVAYADVNNNSQREASEPQAQTTQNFVTLPTPQTTVPDLEGMLESSATKAITAAELTVGTITRLSDAAKPGGGFWNPIGPFVVNQSPAPNALVPKQSKVNITLQRDWLEIDTRL